MFPLANAFVVLHSVMQLWYKDMEHARPLRILCQSGQDLSLTVRDGTAVLARADDKDQRQVVRRSCLKLCSVSAAVVSAAFLTHTRHGVSLAFAALGAELSEHRPRHGRRGTPRVRAGAEALQRQRQPAGTSVRVFLVPSREETGDRHPCRVT